MAKKKLRALPGCMQPSPAQRMLGAWTHPRGAPHLQGETDPDRAQPGRCTERGLVCLG